MANTIKDLQSLKKSIFKRQGLKLKKPKLKCIDP